MPLLISAIYQLPASRAEVCHALLRYHLSSISYQLTFVARAEVALLSSESATGTLNIENRRLKIHITND